MCSLDPTVTKNEAMIVTLEERQHFTDLLKENFALVQNKMKVDVDNRHNQD
jgi:hypothetical protein